MFCINKCSPSSSFLSLVLTTDWERNRCSAVLVIFLDCTISRNISISLFCISGVEKLFRLIMRLEGNIHAEPLEKFFVLMGKDD